MRHSEYLLSCLPLHSLRKRHLPRVSWDAESLICLECCDAESSLAVKAACKDSEFSLQYPETPTSAKRPSVENFSRASLAARAEARPNEDPST